MISGAAILVILVFVPIVFVTATLLVGGDLGEVGISNVSLTLSIIGYAVLLVAVAISPDWRTFPKVGIGQIAFAGLLFSSFHIKCDSLIDMSPTGWGMPSDLSAAVATWFGRLWHRTLVGWGFGLNVLLIHVRGVLAARRVFPYVSALLLVASLGTMVGFAVQDNVDKSRYPCWYHYGQDQVQMDFVLMMLELVFIVGVLITVGNAAPVPMATSPMSRAVTELSAVDVNVNVSAPAPEGTAAGVTMQ
jgi:hypothetical protein